MPSKKVAGSSEIVIQCAERGRDSKRGAGVAGGGEGGSDQKITPKIRSLKNQVNWIVKILNNLLTLNLNTCEQWKLRPQSFVDSLKFKNQFYLKNEIET